MKIMKVSSNKTPEHTTSCIVHLADCANFEGITSNKHCNGLTGSCFESPNDTIHVTVVWHFRKTIATWIKILINRKKE